MGAALYRTVVEGPRDDGGWQSCLAGTWNAAGWGYLTAAGQLVSALRFRQMDGSGEPASAV